MINVLNTKVSLYKNVLSTCKLGDVNLYDYLVKSPSIEDLELINSIRSAATKEVKDDIKKKLPAITPSGTFATRNSAGLIQHSALICLDIDHKENKHHRNYKQLKDQLRNIKNVAYCGSSVSGQGYFVLIPISEPQKHRQHFEALRLDLHSYGVVIDKSCSNVDRLRIYSYDQGAYINTRALVYKKIQETQVVYNEKLLLKNETCNKITEKVESCINQILKSEIDITGDYSDWLKLGFALAHEFEEEGRYFFHLISQFSAKYDHDETDLQFTSCLNNKRNGVTIGTFFHYCKQWNLYPA